MTDIHGILQDVNSAPGAKGSALLTADGIMVASTLPPGFRDDVVAALTSFLIQTTRRSLREAGMGSFRRFVVNSTNGKMILVDLGDSYLIVVTDQFARLDACLMQVQILAERLREVARIRC